VRRDGSDDERECNHQTDDHRQRPDPNRSTHVTRHWDNLVRHFVYGTNREQREEWGENLKASMASDGPGVTMHVLWEVASAVLVIIPLFAVGRAYRQGRSPRLGFAFAAFAVLEVRFALEAAIHSIVAVDHAFEDIFGFLMDLIAIALFAAAFLYGTGWPFGRVGADLT
jgi:hypothetical protein